MHDPFIAVQTQQCAHKPHNQALHMCAYLHLACVFQVPVPFLSAVADLAALSRRATACGLLGSPEVDGACAARGCDPWVARRAEVGGRLAW
eukprot:969015-Prymnesium_polylepis.1